MKFFASLLFTAFLAVLFVFPAAAQTPAPYDVVVIEQFTVREGVEFSDDNVVKLTASLVQNFKDSRRFPHVFLSTNEASSSVEGRHVKITGEIVKYQKGSQAARYLVGLGAGKTKLIADVTLTDIATGEVVMRETIDGVVSAGLFGGSKDSAKGDLVSDLIKSMTKKGYARKQRLK